MKIRIVKIPNSYSNGGTLDPNKANFSNGVIEINAGGTHELNPMEGILLGVDNEGVPNLVEEGEVVWNDYVFSNRLKVPKAVRSKYRLRSNKDITFADAAKKISKESEERPNDPISQNGLESMLGVLAYVQENERMKKDKNNNLGNKFSDGGDTWADVVNKSLPSWVSAQRSVKGAPSILESSEETKLSSGLDTLESDNYIYPTWPRYAPIVASGVGILTDALGLTNTPDYSNADMMLGATRNNRRYTPVAAERLGNYLTYRPLDTNYQLNKLLSLTAASRRAIANQSGGNRAASIAGLTNLDYNTSNAIGDMIVKANEYNTSLRERVGTFNRDTDLINADLGLKAAMANQSTLLHILDQTLQGMYNVAQIRERAKAASDTARSANLTNFVLGLADLGSENLGWNQLQWAYDHGVFGPLLGRITRDYRPRALGGLLTKKRKGYGI